MRITVRATYNFPDKKEMHLINVPNIRCNSNLNVILSRARSNNDDGPICLSLSLPLLSKLPLLRYVWLQMQWAQVMRMRVRWKEREREREKVKVFFHQILLTLTHFMDNFFLVHFFPHLIDGSCWYDGANTIWTSKASTQSSNRH